MISIIIPTYNRAHTLSLSIRSILNQTHQSWELIIVDDGSIDNTIDMVSQFLKDDRVKYFHQENQGVSVARNLGAEMSNGDYLIFLDSDDTLDKDLLRNLENSFYSDYDLICWEFRMIIDEENNLGKPKKLGYLYNFRTASFLAGSVCYKKSVFFEVGGYDPYLTFGENYELGLRICQKKVLNISILNKVLASFFIEKSKRTSNSISNRLYSLIYYYKKHRELYDSNREECSRINYQLGYLLKNSRKKKFAIKFYKKSWKISPWKIKPFLIFFYLKFLSK